MAKAEVKGNDQFISVFIVPSTKKTIIFKKNSTIFLPKSVTPK